MITKTQLGENHQDITRVSFGTGEVMFTKLQMSDGSFGLAFAQAAPHQIGEVTNEYAGKDVDDFKEEIKVLFTFTKVASVTSLIHSLIELQKGMLDGKL